MSKLRWFIQQILVITVVLLCVRTVFGADGDPGSSTLDYQQLVSSVVGFLIALLLHKRLPWAFVDTFWGKLAIAFLIGALGGIKPILDAGTFSVHALQTAITVGIASAAALIVPADKSASTSSGPPATLLVFLLATQSACTPAQSAAWRTVGVNVFTTCLEAGVKVDANTALDDLLELAKNGSLDFASAAKQLASQFGISTAVCAAEQLLAGLPDIINAKSKYGEALKADDNTVTRARAIANYLLVNRHSLR
jgi:hypothetical protein